MEWTCEICGALRDDADIDVAQLNLQLKGGGQVGRNVRHCRDNEVCEHGARCALEEFRMVVEDYLGGYKTCARCDNPQFSSITKLCVDCWSSVHESPDATHDVDAI